MTSSISEVEKSDWMFDRIVSNLRSLFGYPASEAILLTQDYYRLFRDQSFCNSIGIGLQDQDFFEHEAPMGMAMRVHYYLGLKEDPDPREFIQWRRVFQLRQRESESKR